MYRGLRNGYCYCSHVKKLWLIDWLLCGACCFFPVTTVTTVNKRKQKKTTRTTTTGWHNYCENITQITTLQFQTHNTCGTMACRTQASSYTSSPVCSVFIVSRTCDTRGVQRACRLRLKHSSKWQCSSCGKSRPEHNINQWPPWRSIN